MAGYWPSSFFACLWTETESRAINTQQRTRPGQYQAILTEQAWSIKDLLYGFRRDFSCDTKRVVPSGQDSFILPTRGTLSLPKRKVYLFFTIELSKETQNAVVLVGGGFRLNE